MGVRVQGNKEATASNNAVTDPGSMVTYWVIIDNDSSVKVKVQSLLDSVHGTITNCQTAGGAPTVIGIELDPDNGDGPGDVDPDGLDAVSCKYQVTAPPTSGTEVKNVVTTAVQAGDGQIGTDFDDNTKFTTS
jgi:hypothetical protein